MYFKFYKQKKKTIYIHNLVHRRVAKANLGRYAWKYKLQFIMISEIKKVQFQWKNDYKHGENKSVGPRVLKYIICTILG